MVDFMGLNGASFGFRDKAIHTRVVRRMRFLVRLTMAPFFSALDFSGRLDLFQKNLALLREKGQCFRQRLHVKFLQKEIVFLVPKDLLFQPRL